MSIQILVRLYRDPISNIKLWTVIHNTAVADCCVIEPTLTDEINKISSLSFSVYAGHPQIANLDPDAHPETEVWVVQRITAAEKPSDEWHSEGTNQWRRNMFVGHVKNATPKSDNGITTYHYLVVSPMDYLNDTVCVRHAIDMSEETGGGVNQAFVDFGDAHDAQVTAGSYKTLNFITGRTNQYNNYNYIQDWDTTWNGINDKIISKFGGEMYYVYNEEFDYGQVTWQDEQNGQHTNLLIDRGLNLKRVEVTTDYDELFTRIYPVGATNDDGSRVSLENYPATSNLPYIDIIDPSIVDPATYQARDELYYRLGIKSKLVEWDDVTTQAHLYAKAKQYIIDYCTRIKKSYAVAAIDLSELNGDPNEMFIIGNYYIVKDDTIGLNEELRVIRIVYDLAHPHKTQITFGDKFFNQEEQRDSEWKEMKNVTGTITYNANSKADKITADLEALTDTVEYGGGYESVSTLSGKELCTEWTWANTNPPIPTGKIGIDSEQEGIVGYVWDSTNNHWSPALFITNYGAISTKGSIALTDDFGDLTLKINGNTVSLRDYLTNHP